MFAIILCVLVIGIGFYLWLRYAIPAEQCSNDVVAIVFGNCNGTMFAYSASEPIMAVGAVGLFFSIFGFKRDRK
jgi:hypothetical protein